ncbi:MAG: SPOR domain-containing protein [Proteobacteria bacterium]|nr:SPOR domain-containing protein [Pseudomonadota bacterium]
MPRKWVLLFKSILVVMLLSAVAWAFSVFVMRWKMQRLFDMYKVMDHKVSPSLFFYDTIGSSPPGAVEVFSGSDLVTEVMPTGAVKQQALVRQFTVKVAVVSAKSAAEAVVAELNEKGLPATITSFEDQGKSSYRVNMGLYRDAKEAAGALQDLTLRTSYRGEVIDFP